MPNISYYRDEIKLTLTGGILELEIDDMTLDKIINSAFREIQRYIDLTVTETVPYSRCIDLNPRKINTIVNIYRTKGIGYSATKSGITDPAYLMQWQMFSPTGSVMYNYDNFVQNYASWMTAIQIRNTLSTDLAFRYERDKNLLYINTIDTDPTDITIEYVPRFDDISEIYSDYWIDVIMKLALAKTKIILGRIRSRFTQSNALWNQDGDKLLQEGNDELKQVEEQLKADTQLAYLYD